MSYTTEIPTVIKIGLWDRIRLLFIGKMEIVLKFKSDQPLELDDDDVIFKDED